MFALGLLGRVQQLTMPAGQLLITVQSLLLAVAAVVAIRHQVAPASHQASSSVPIDRLSPLSLPVGNQASPKVDRSVTVTTKDTADGWVTGRVLPSVVELTGSKSLAQTGVTFRPALHNWQVGGETSGGISLIGYRNIQFPEYEEERVELKRGGNRQADWTKSRLVSGQVNAVLVAESGNNQGSAHLPYTIVSNSSIPNHDIDLNRNVAVASLNPTVKKNVETKLYPIYGPSGSINPSAPLENTGSGVVTRSTGSSLTSTKSTRLPSNKARANAVLGVAPPLAHSSYVRLYSDAWDIVSRKTTPTLTTPSHPKPTLSTVSSNNYNNSADGEYLHSRQQRPHKQPQPLSNEASSEPNDSLSALEFKLLQHNLTLHDVAMQFLLRDDTNLTALFPRLNTGTRSSTLGVRRGSVPESVWPVDDANMTLSIKVMNRLFRVLQQQLLLDGAMSDILTQRANAPDEHGPYNVRLVRRTWNHGAASRPNRLSPPVIHQYRASTDHRFIGQRQSCGSGQCEFFMMCWMSGGVVQGGCGGFLFGCCQRYQRDAKSFTPAPQIDYGPVQNEEGCGLSDTSRIGITRRIVGGTQAGFGTFPWQAYILIGTSRCGGSLVSRQHVVTAGHCVARARAGQISVTLGDYVLNSNREPLPAYKFRVKTINVHPNFRFTPQADRYDVAVLKLNRPVPYVPHIQPICIPDKGADFEGYYGWAAGWGALRPGSRLRPKELQVVDVPIINGHLCEAWHRQKGINVVIHEEMMCAGYINGGKDSCQGDSGGPLMMEVESRWYLMGIVSAGYSCAQGKQPGIYHRVPVTSDWISYVVHR